MKQLMVFCVLLVALSLHLEAQINFSGLLDSTVSLNAGAGDAKAFSFGIEEYANIRMQARLRERGRFEGAVNFIAAAGDYTLAARQLAEIPGMAQTSFIGGDNFIAGIELERLHFRLNFEETDFDGGLMRLPFGYGQVWGSSDFINPPNPLKPDARPRAVLAAALTWYPLDELKFIGFAAAPRDPFSQGEGMLTGLSMDKHWEGSRLAASLQTLYSFETPQDGSNRGIIHRAGLSLKADVEVGLVIDALYTYNHQAGTGHEGLSLSAGFDYSFFDGDLVVLTEYLYNGSASSTAAGYGGSFSNEHYLYTGFTWRFNDFTNAGLALIWGLTDVSFTPIISLNHDIFQGATLMFTGHIPLDRDVFTGSGRRGELGPLPPGFDIGSYFYCTIKLRLRF